MPLRPRDELAHVFGAHGDVAQIVVDENDLRHAVLPGFSSVDLQVHWDGIVAVGREELGAGPWQPEDTTW